MTFQAAMDALETDAGVWGTVSQELQTASGNAAAIGLTGREWSKTATEVGLVGTYQQIQQLVTTLCNEGSVEAGNIKATLQHVKQQYELDDDAARQKFDGVWDAPR